MKEEAETLGLWFGSRLRCRGPFEAAPTLRFLLRPAAWEARRASLITLVSLFTSLSLGLVPSPLILSAFPA